jgi:hypothetical protein
LRDTRSTGALNAGKPIKEPQTHGAGDIENHLADLDLQLTVRCCRCHRASPFLVQKWIEISAILDTFENRVLLKIPHQGVKTQEKL